MVAMHTWQPLPMSDVPGDIAVRGRRLRVPGGWLYQIEITEVVRLFDDRNSNVQSSYQMRDGYHPPVFVPDPSSGGSDV